jgi:hypothetical protein
MLYGKRDRNVAGQSVRRWRATMERMAAARRVEAAMRRKED